MGPRPAPPEGFRLGRGLATVKCKYGFPYGFVDRFVVKVGLDQDGAFFLESDVPDSGTGILAGAARIVATELGLAEVPRLRLSEAIIADPSGSDFQHGRRPSPLAAWAFRSLEAMQSIQAAAAMMVVVRTTGRFEARLLRALARPINWLNGAMNWIKSRLFPYSIDSFVPRTSSSRGMFMVGQAAVDAAERFRAAAIEAVAGLLGVAKGALEWRADGIRHPGPAARIIPWRDVARAAGGSLAGLGRARIPEGLLLNPRTGIQVGAVDHMYASQGVDLAVHPATGEVKILRIVTCQDVGKLFDAEVVRGQIIGALTMGAGQVLWEKIFTAHGAPANANMHDYLIPSMLDMTAEPTIEILESGSGLGPGGAKGVGEAGAVVTPIAIAHALYDALGVQVTRIPVTPEELVELMDLPATGETAEED
jgi:CO/xanthine dehydrogenase Mo-binding subunit